MLPLLITLRRVIRRWSGLSRCDEGTLRYPSTGVEHLDGRTFNTWVQRIVNGSSLSTNHRLKLRGWYMGMYHPDNFIRGHCSSTIGRLQAKSFLFQPAKCTKTHIFAHQIKKICGDNAQTALWTVAPLPGPILFEPPTHHSGPLALQSSNVQPLCFYPPIFFTILRVW